MTEGTGSGQGGDAERRRARNRARAAAIHGRGAGRDGGTDGDPWPRSDAGREPPSGPLARLTRLALEEPAPGGPGVVVARGVLWLGLLYHGLRYAGLEPHRAQVSRGLVDTILGMADLVFHEAGHIILAPLGDFMTALGGSLFQVLVPAAFLVAFLTRYRDPFGASAMLWWTGQNLVDVAPYIDDARSRTLVLLGGVTGRDVPGYHDWNNVLGRLGWLEYDQALALWVHRAGALLLLTALAWGGLLLFGQYRRLQIAAGSGTPRR